MALTPTADCTTAIEDLKLLHAKDYMNLVSSGVSGLGAVPTSWPPGPQPEPYKWTDSRGTTWTLVQLDGAWRYRDGKTNTFISPSNLLDLMGVRKNEINGAPLPTEKIPGTSNADRIRQEGMKTSGFNLSTTMIGGLSLGWAIIIGTGIYYSYKTFKPNKPAVRRKVKKMRITPRKPPNREIKRLDMNTINYGI